MSLAILVFTVAYYVGEQIVDSCTTLFLLLAQLKLLCSALDAFCCPLFTVFSVFFFFNEPLDSQASMPKKNSLHQALKLFSRNYFMKNVTISSVLQNILETKNVVIHGCDLISD